MSTPPVQWGSRQEKRRLASLLAASGNVWFFFFGALLRSLISFDGVVVVESPSSSSHLFFSLFFPYNHQKTTTQNMSVIAHVDHGEWDVDWGESSERRRGDFSRSRSRSLTFNRWSEKKNDDGG